MNHSRASGSPIAATLGGTKRSLRRLSRRDFGVLMERMPVDNPGERRFLTPFDVHRWAATEPGSVVVIAIASLLKEYTGEDLDARLVEVGDEDGEWGSMVQQATVASHLVAESLVRGEEPAKDSEGEQSSDPISTTATTPTKPE